AGCAATNTGSTPSSVNTASAAAVATSAPTHVNTPAGLATATSPSIPTAIPLTVATATNIPAAAAPVPSATAQSASLDFNFDKDAAGGLPSGAISFSGAWAVRAEADTPSPPNALCQTGTATYPAL